MLRPMWSTSLFLLSWTFWGGGVLGPPPAPGSTLWARGITRHKAPWTAKLPPAPSRLMLLELEGHGPFADLDLSVAGSKAPRTATSHLARELLLVRTPQRTGLRLKVFPGGARPGQFRLGLTPLAPRRALLRGATARAKLGGKTRVHLYTLSVLQSSRLRVRLTRESGKGDVDLLVFDPSLDLVELGATRPTFEEASLTVRANRVWRVVVVSRGGPASYRLQVERAPAAPGPLEGFLRKLAKTPNQAKAVRALRRNPDFVRIKSYLERYPSGVPLRLRVVPGLMAHGVERFGTYSQGTLTINPTIPGHKQNVQELVDTLLHELVHAILALPRAGGFPLAPDVLDSSHDPRLRGSAGTPLRRGRLAKPLAAYLDTNYGPSASNPHEDYTDINAGAQRLIIKVVRHNMARTGLGSKTLVFANERARQRRLGTASAK